MVKRTQNTGYYEDEIKELKNEREIIDFIDDHEYDMTRTDWHYITKHPKLTFNLMMRYADNVHWEHICTFRKLTETEIETAKDYVNWYEVSAFQKLSIGFIKKYKDKLSLDAIMRHDKLSSSERSEFIDIFNKNNDPKHHKIWDENLQKAKIFCPKVFRSKYNDYPGARMDEEPTKHYGIYQGQAPGIEKNNENEKSKGKKDKKTSKKNVQTEVKIVEQAKEVVKTSKPKTTTKKPKKKSIDYSVMTKAQLKQILDERKVRYLYHDTIEILRKKCKESE